MWNLAKNHIKNIDTYIIELICQLDNANWKEELGSLSVKANEE